MESAVPEPAVPGAACRNCGAPVQDAYCARCGQETTARLPSARQFLKDAAGRYVALDGRMWRTLAALILHPGYLTREYFAGRRRRYIRPARLFLVLSLLMFATIRVVIGVPNIDEAVVIDDPRPAATKPPPAAPAPGAPSRGDTVRAAVEEMKAEVGTQGPGVVLPGMAFTVDQEGHLRVRGPGPVVRVLDQRLERFNALPRQERFEQLVTGTIRYGPYAMFVLLPAFAFLLMAIHRRSHVHRGRPQLYAEHLVFAAHNHAFFFAIVTLMVVVPSPPLRAILAVWSLVYALWSLRVVYGGGWIALLARSWALAITYFVLFVIVTVALILVAVLVR